MIIAEDSRGFRSGPEGGHNVNKARTWVHADRTDDRGVDHRHSGGDRAPGLSGLCKAGKDLRSHYCLKPMQNRDQSLFPTRWCSAGGAEQLWLRKVDAIDFVREIDPNGRRWKRRGDAAEH